MAYRKHSQWVYMRRITTKIWRHPSNRHRRARALAASVAWQLRKRLTGRPKDVTFHGWTLRCHPDSNSASNVVYFTEWYDPLEMAFLAAYLRPGDGFVDVGANIGTYSLLARSIVGPTGHVEGFEPSPVAAERFEENVRLNQIENITVHAAAVGAAPGSVDFLVGLDVSNRVAVASDAGFETLSVPVVRLDDVLGDAHFALGKIDVEGHETAAFEGGVGRLTHADPPVWQVELLENQLRRAGSSRDEVIAALASYGFRLAIYEPQRSAMRYLAEDEAHPSNVWAVHESAVDDVAGRISGR